MIEYQYNNPNKVYVTVEAVFKPDGRLMPTAFVWENGCRYEIDRVTGVCRAASLKCGGIGMRYTCIVGGHQTYMFYEEGRWFMEQRN
ncbi:MAG TPA: hypothetical protein GXZ59_05990 [Clostridiaceae bacterium]|jgi:hypothetical protein|nr:hypothetical protein [Clostridiaceae bacterium]